MRLAVLDLTTHTEPLLQGLPRVGPQIRDWLGPVLPEAEFAIVDVATDGTPMPQVDGFDGLIVSGSEYGVYDDVPWIMPLRALLDATRAAGRPIFGICFGHQIMADTFGGKAKKAASGLAVGAMPFEAGGQVADAYFWHQDQVTRVPSGARVTGHAAHCPVGALDYDFPARSVQFHPEYDEVQLRALFERGRDVFIDGAAVDAALETFADADVAADLQAGETAAFFRRHIPR